AQTPTPHSPPAPRRVTQRTQTDHAEPVASPTSLGPSPAEPRGCPQARRVAEPLLCGSFPQVRTGRWRHDTYRAVGSTPGRAGVAGLSRGLFRSRLVEASP